MPTARYKFVRDTSSALGLHSNQRPSTNAVNALLAWSQAVAGRSYTEVSDDDESLVAALTWNDADEDAGPSLEDACQRFGVERSYVSK
jgi:hypothetical protein